MIFNKPYIPFGTAIERDNFLKKISTVISKSQKRKNLLL